jgi:hypothetical protein
VSLAVQPEHGTGEKMTRYLAAVLLIAITMSVASAQAAEQTVTSASITFGTTGDDKDFDTQVFARIVYGDHDAAILHCCAADRRGDHWNSGTSEMRPMNIIQRLSKSEMRHFRLIITSIANGNDRWMFIPTLTVTFSDGTKEQWTLAETTLNSRGSSAASQTYDISNP